MAQNFIGSTENLQSNMQMSSQEELKKSNSSGDVTMQELFEDKETPFGHPESAFEVRGSTMPSNTEAESTAKDGSGWSFPANFSTKVTKPSSDVINEAVKSQDNPSDQEKPDDVEEKKVERNSNIWLEHLDKAR